MFIVQVRARLVVVLQRATTTIPSAMEDNHLDSANGMTGGESITTYSNFPLSWSTSLTMASEVSRSMALGLLTPAPSTVRFGGAMGSRGSSSIMLGRIS